MSDEKGSDMDHSKGCGYCIYEIQRQCRRNAPIAGVKDSDKWPYIGPYDKCGQWVERCKNET